jgi:hypothetical protein
VARQDCSRLGCTALSVRVLDEKRQRQLIAGASLPAYESGR